MKVKKLAGLGLSIAIGVGLIAGCSSSNTSSSADSSKSPQTISVIIQNSVLTSPKVAQDLAKEFEASHPNIKVQINCVPDEQIFNKDRIGASTGELADIFQINTGEATTQLLNKGGYLSDLSGLSSAKNLLPAIKDQSMVNGKLVDFSVGVGVLGFLYNKDLFKQVGFDSPPKTWEDLMKAGKLLDKNNKKLLVYSGKWLTGIAPNFHWEFGNLAAKDPAFKEAYVKNTIDWSKPAYHDALINGYKRFDELNKYVLTGSFTNEYQVAQQAFVKGDVAMIMGGTWDAGYIRSLNPNFQIGFMNLPYASEASNSFIFTPEDGLALNAKSKHIEAAKTFLDWLFSKETYTKINANKKNFSSEVGVGTLDPMYSDIPAWLKTNRVEPFADVGTIPTDGWTKLGQTAQSTTFGTSIDDAAKTFIDQYNQNKSK